MRMHACLHLCVALRHACLSCEERKMESLDIPNDAIGLLPLSSCGPLYLHQACCDSEAIARTFGYFLLKGMLIQVN